METYHIYYSVTLNGQTIDLHDEFENLTDAEAHVELLQREAVASSIVVSW